MEMNGYDFRTALEELARQANVTLREQSPQEAKTESEAERLRALLSSAISYYHTLLMTAPQAATHGLTCATVDSPTPLSRPLARVQHGRLGRCRTHLMGQGFTVEEQIKAGMLIERDDGSTYDRFRNRVMIPIYDRRGRPIAFGGRVLQPDQQPSISTHHRRSSSTKDRCSSATIWQAAQSVIRMPWSSSRATWT